MNKSKAIIVISSVAIAVSIAVTGSYFGLIKPKLSSKSPAESEAATTVAPENTATQKDRFRLKTLVTTHDDGSSERKEYAYSDNGKIIEINYDENNNMIFELDNLGRIINDGFCKYSYDENNCITNKTSEDFSCTFKYDSSKKLIESMIYQDEEESTEKYIYNSNGNMIKTVSDYDGADDFKESYEYDSNNRLIKKASNTDAGIEYTTYTYDTQGRIIRSEIFSPISGNKANEYKYNSNGFVSSYIFNYNYQYDIENDDAYIGSYEYNSSNKVIKNTYDGNTITYEYDDNGLISKIKSVTHYKNENEVEIEETAVLEYSYEKIPDGEISLNKMYYNNNLYSSDYPEKAINLNNKVIDIDDILDAYGFPHLYL